VTGRILFESDLSTSALKTRQIGIIGYGSQGRAQSLNLRDSGFVPLIGIRPGPSFDAASQDGFSPTRPADAASGSDIIMVLTPDETHADICNNHIFPAAAEGTHIGFAAGFTVHYGVVRMPEGLHPIMVAPKGPGHVLRRRFLSGGGIPALVAAQGDDAEGLEIAKAYAKALGCARAGVVETTFREEAVADLFGEQTVLCGGLVELMKTAFDILVDRGYTPEVAYIECIAEVEYIASLISKVGLADLAGHISSTAFYGGTSRGVRVVGADIRERLEGILDEIENGHFYEEFRGYAQGRITPRTEPGRLERIERARKEFEGGQKDAG
jgi:ketol-acid reductoisomerase